MQTNRSRSRSHASARTAVVLGILALVVGPGCDEGRPPNDPQPPAEGANHVAPLYVAPESVRIPGEYIVVFETGVSASSIESAAQWVSQAGGTNEILHRYSVIPGFAARLDDAVLGRLRSSPGMAYLEENQRVQLNATFPSPADGIDRTDQRKGRDGAYNDHDRTGANVHIYVLDTGINTSHTEFTGRIGAGYTAINDGNGIEDCHGHGTHVSSTAAGTAYGIAKQALIHPIRVLGCTGSGTWDGVIAGVNFVHERCLVNQSPCVANMSLGGQTHAAVNQAVTNAVNAGVTFVVAAGNSNQNACNFSPAGTPAAITAAAIDDADARATFSNWGLCVDIFAPGVSILGAFTGGTTAAASLSGTSMASPHVAGVAAQYLSTNPGATPAQVELTIKGSASLECVSDPQGSPNVLLFNDLNQGTYQCNNQPTTCKDLCGQAGDGCFCDADCERFNDCCDDYAAVCK